MIVLGHGGGAPEAAMIGLPLVLFVVFIWLERRARRRESRLDPLDGDELDTRGAAGG